MFIYLQAEELKLRATLQLLPQKESKLQRRRKIHHTRWWLRVVDFCATSVVPDVRIKKVCLST